MCLKLLNILLIKQILFYDIQGVELASYIISNKMIDLGIVGYFGIGTIGYTMVPANTKNKEEIMKRVFYWSHLLSILTLLYVGIFSHVLPYLTSDIVVINKIKEKIPLLYSILVVQGYSNNYDGLLLGYKKFHIQTLFALFTLLTGKICFSFSKNINHLWYSILSIYSLRL